MQKSLIYTCIQVLFTNLKATKRIEYTPKIKFLLDIIMHVILKSFVDFIQIFAILMLQKFYYVLTLQFHRIRFYCFVLTLSNRFSNRKNY